MEFADWRYGLIVHYGLYSLLGRGEWVMNREAIPPDEYRKLMDRFTAEAFDANAICDLAVRAGMRYVNLTTMHHDGFRLYETELTDFNAKAACGRDLVQEFVDAARKRGLKVELYHSLNNWSDQPDAVAALENRADYDRFIQKTFERIKELVTRFNPIDVLWYDGWWPWEACLTLNDCWGFNPNDHNWKTPRAVLDSLVQVATQRGNLLLNIGPRGDGSIPEESVAILERVGEWLARYGEGVLDSEVFTFDLQTRGDHRGDVVAQGSLTVRGNDLYLLAFRWPGETLTICGLETPVQSVTLLGETPREVSFTQEGPKLTVRDLPAEPPDTLCPVVRVTCAEPPRMYWTGGMRVPNAPHPHYDPAPSNLVTMG